MVELTVGEVAKRLGVDEVKIVKEKPVMKEEPKYVFKHGDIVTSDGSGSTGRRIFIKVDDELKIYTSAGDEMGGAESIQKYAERFNYKKIGELRDTFK